MAAEEPRSDGSRALDDAPTPAGPRSSRPPFPEEDEAPRPLRWKANLALFLATVVSVFFMGAVYEPGLPAGGGMMGLLRAIPSGWPFAVPLLAILLTHEFGHFIAARIHGVDASLPFFIPLPVLSPFGTMGAV